MERTRTYESSAGADTPTLQSRTPDQPLSEKEDR